MTVMSVSEVYSQANTTTSTTEAVMGKDDFLTLLITQLKNQDPLNPSDSTEFTAQLAQFSSLEQLQNINDALASFEVYQSTANNIQASNFIGQTVTAAGDTISVSNGASDSLSVALDAPAQTVYIQIYDAYGEYVTDIEAGSLDAGMHTIAWDATDQYGAAVEDGRYTFSVMAVDGDGNSVSSTSYITGQVTGVDYQSGETMLLIGDQEVSIASLIRVEDLNTDNNES
ncbi:FlgD: predicted flagellar hook capping protein [Desulfosarcina variabilis str. Montpellier]|uniref:flagellar hook assembly protein FlgD n=1 Tax=Desulfosarcina variabilis TaxID=2300 RepID=UPI003AFAE7B3